MLASAKLPRLGLMDKAGALSLQYGTLGLEFRF